MAVIYLPLWSLDIDLPAPLRKVSIRSMQYVLVVLQYEEASTYSIKI